MHSTKKKNGKFALGSDKLKGSWVSKNFIHTEEIFFAYLYNYVNSKVDNR